MASVRSLPRSSRPLDQVLHSSSSSTSTVRALKGGKMKAGPKKGKKHAPMAVKASAATSETEVVTEPRVGQGLDLGSLARDVSDFVLKVLKIRLKRRNSKLQFQRFIEKMIMNCRFFTFFGVAGSLIGSVLCFVEGFLQVLESYFHYFNLISQIPEGHVVHLLVEAIDMFLLGTSMLIFGMGLYTMFVGTRTNNGNPLSRPATSNLHGVFPVKAENRLPKWAETESVSQAKSRIGYAVVMMLHVGMLDKFRNVPLVSSLDLACFAGSVFVSSASMFFLSRLSAAKAAV